VEWQWSIWVTWELAACIGLATLTFYSRNIIPTHVRNPGLLLLTLGTAYIFLNAMEIGTGTPATKFMFFKFQYVLVAIISTIWLAFILQYISEGKRFAPRTLALFSILPFVVAVLALTNEVHHLFWTGSSPSNNYFLFFYREGPLFWFSEAFIWAIFLYGVFLLVRQLRLMTEPLRGDAFTILFAAIVVLITGIFDAANIEQNLPYPLSSLSIGFTIAFILIVFGFRYLRTTHIRPIAQQAAIDSLADTIIAMDKQNRVFYMNTAAEKLTGHILSNAYQRPLKELLPSWPQEILNIVQQPSWLAKEIGIEDNGKHSWYEIGLSPIHDSVGNLIGRVMIVRDITGRIKAEDERRDIERKAQLASRLSTVGQMAAGICHEINNPLTTVIGYSDLLLNKDLPGDIKQDLGYIREGGRRVADIVRQLLVFARNMRPARTMVDINDIVSGTLILREYQLRLANINVLTELAPDLPYIVADPGQIQQVFLNIVLNAETEMKLAHGQGTLLVKTECINDAIRVSFNDDGPGISEENLNNIFDPFFTTRKTGEGTGLGLSVCHGIISEHNGRIYAQSKSDKGATFIVELPIVSEFASAEIPGAADKEIQQVRTRPGNILIIDDDPLLLKFLEEFLITKGHDVDAVDNAHDARKVFKNRKYDLILMDILMPDVSGIELYKKFQRMDKSVGSRVLIMTGDTLGKPTRTFLYRTRVPYIEKPFEPDALLTKIDEIMSQNR
jgi:PAS domain S-box-containing protein